MAKEFQLGNVSSVSVKPGLLRDDEKLRKIHFIETYNVKTTFNTINTWDQLPTEENRSVEYTLCKSHRTILFHHRALLSTRNPLRGIT